MADSTLAKYMPRRRKPPSPTWRTFPANHVGEIAAIDSFTVRMATFRILFCYLGFRRARGRVVYFPVTMHSTAARRAQQVVEACPYDEKPRYLLRDRDAVYGKAFAAGCGAWESTKSSSRPAHPGRTRTSSA